MNKTSKWILVIGGCISLGGLTAFVFAVDVLHIHFGYGAAAERYRNAGMPWTAADLPQVQGSSSDTERFFQAVSLFEGVQPRLPDLDPGLYTPQSPSVLNSYLASRTKLLDELRIAAVKPTPWTKEWERGPDLLFPELAQMKEAVKALAVRCEIRSYQGDLSGSLSDLKLGADISRRAGEGGVVICHLVQLALRSIMFRAAQRAASYHLDDPEALRAFVAAIAAYEPDPTLGVSLRYEAYTSLALLRSLGYDSLWTASSPSKAIEDAAISGSVERPVVKDGDPRHFFARSFAVPFLKVYAEAGEIMKDKGESSAVMLEVTRMMEQRTQESRGLSASLARVLMPVYRQAAVAGIKSSAERAALQAALLAAAVKAEKRILPDKEIDSLMPGDPFTGRPMTWSVEGASIKVWSVGEDGKDDRGRSKEDASFAKSRNLLRPGDSGTFDYVAALPFRPSRAALERARRVQTPGGPPSGRPGLMPSDLQPEKGP